MISYDFINDYLRKTLSPSKGILKDLELYAEQNHVPIIQPEVAKLLTIVGSLLKPERILELGTAIGYSSILMSGFLKENGKIETVERYDKMIEISRNNIKEAGLDDKIVVIAGDALEVLECLNKTYDLIFMDAAKGQYPEFLPHCLRLLRSGGLLVSDNILYRGMVANDELVERRKKTIVQRLRTYLDMLCSSPELETSILPVGDGVALSYKK